MNISWLRTQAGAALLSQLTPYEAQDVLRLSTKLRHDGYHPDLIRSALTQNQLRQKAQEKFSAAQCATMLFTPAGLEQATRFPVAQLHAQHFLKSQLTQIVDFGCGIGADSLAFAAAQMQVTAIEKDSETALAAQHNLAPYQNATVIHADGSQLSLSEFTTGAIWLDPARRKNGKRINNPENWFPALSEAIALAHNFTAAGIKLAPGISYEYLPADAFVTWISSGRKLLEAVLWLGAAAPRPGRAAWILPADLSAVPAAQTPTCLTLTQLDTPPNLAPIFAPPAPLGAYLYEPDPAVIRAGLIHQLVQEFQLHPVSAKIAYLSSDQKIDSPFLTRFQVQEVLPLQIKKVRRRLAELAIGSVEIKKRGIDLEPASFRKALVLKPTQHKNTATLIATQLLGKHQLIRATRD